MYNIYLISSEINNEKLYKIGYTKRDVNTRIREFKTGNASEFLIVDSFKSKWGTKIEAFLKRTFKCYNVSGEWFNLPVEEINNFYKICELMHNNLELLYNNNTFIVDNGFLD